MEGEGGRGGEKEEGKWEVERGETEKGGTEGKKHKNIATHPKYNHNPGDGYILKRVYGLLKLDSVGLK